MKKIKDLVINFFNGMCMSIADSVPGVSGGTVAFILGFYEKFIISLDTIFHGTKDEKKKAFIYLLKIGSGWIFGLLISVYMLATSFQDNIYVLSSIFIGFIVFAIPIVLKEEKNALRENYFNILFLLLGILFVFVITFLNRSQGGYLNINNFNIGTIIYVFLAAALAISAMILPGISGSTLLLIFGIYLPIINNIKEFLHFNLSVVPILTVFGLGMIFGVIFFTKLLRICLKKKRSATIYAIIGMMIGSIYAIIMGPTTLDIPKEHLTFSSFNILYFILGGAIVLSLEGIKYLIGTKNK